MIYFIQCHNHVKIGYSKDPIKRLKELQTGNPYKLNLIGTVPGSLADEKIYHSYFSSNIISKESEWFLLEKRKEGLNACVLALQGKYKHKKSMRLPKKLKEINSLMDLIIAGFFCEITYMSIRALKDKVEHMDTNSKEIFKKLRHIMPEHKKIRAVLNYSSIIE